MARRRRNKMKATEDSKPDLTPMIDCVFLLLIFFMCSMNFVKSEGIIKSFLPKNRGQGTGTPEIDLSEVRVKLLWYSPDTNRPTNDKDNGEVVLKVGTKIYQNIGSLPDYDQLYADLIGHRESYKGSGDKGLPVIIDGRKQIPFKHVVYVLNACIKANIVDVTFAAPEKPYD